MTRTVCISQVARTIEALVPREVRLVLIDGLGGAGKSVLARALAGELGASAMRPDAAATLVVDGQGRIGLDPRRNVVVLEARPPCDDLA